AAHDPGANVMEAARREIVIDAGRAAVVSEHLPERSRGEDPFVQCGTTDAERILEVLMGAGAVAIDRNGKTMDAKPGRDRSTQFAAGFTDCVMARHGR